MGLPGDSHVHSEWSWDAPLGSMERSCAEAVKLGLPAIAFTEHVDHTVFTVPADGPFASDHLTSLAGVDGTLAPPEFDPAGYPRPWPRRTASDPARTPPTSGPAPTDLGAGFRRSQSVWWTMLTTLPSGARTRNRCTPHSSMVNGWTIS